MIQTPNRSPCNGNTRGPLLLRNFVCNNLPERSWQQFSGTQKVFRFWNSCHTHTHTHKATITGDTYGLRENIKQKRRGKLLAGVLLLHDYAPEHKSRTSRAAVRKCDFVELNHPPYSPDLALSHYFLFRNLKKILRGQRFPNDNAGKETVIV